MSRRSKSLTFQANYTFSRTIDDNTDFNNDFMPFRPTRLKLERALSPFNISHNFVASAVYAMPFRAGQGNVFSSIFSDLTLSPIVAIRSGIPFTCAFPACRTEPRASNSTRGRGMQAGIPALARDSNP